MQEGPGVLSEVLQMILMVVWAEKLNCVLRGATGSAGLEGGRELEPESKPPFQW